MSPVLSHPSALNDSGERVVVVSRGDPRAPDLQLAGCGGVPWQRLGRLGGVGTGDAGLDADGGLSDSGPELGPGSLGERRVEGRLTWHTAPPGLVSVMPQAWRMGRPTLAS